MFSSIHLTNETKKQIETPFEFLAVWDKYLGHANNYFLNEFWNIMYSESEN